MSPEEVHELLEKLAQIAERMRPADPPQVQPLPPYWPAPPVPPAPPAPPQAAPGHGGAGGCGNCCPPCGCSIPPVDGQYQHTAARFNDTSSHTVATQQQLFAQQAAAQGAALLRLQHDVTHPILVPSHRQADDVA